MTRRLLPGGLEERIQLSNAAVAEDASVGDVVGTLSVSNASGSYTFTIIADPDSKFAIDGDDLKVDAALDYDTATSHPVTIEAENGVDDPISRTFTISVIEVPLPVPVLTCVSEPEDDTPAFTFDLPPGVILAGDGWTLQLDTVNTFDGADFIEVTDTVSVDDAGDLVIDFELPEYLANDGWFGRLKVDGKTEWSNVESFTIDAPLHMTSPDSFEMETDGVETFVGLLSATRPSTYAFGGPDGALFEEQGGGFGFIAAPSGSGEDNYDLTITPTAIDDSEEGVAQAVAVHTIGTYTEQGVHFDGATNSLQRDTGWAGVVPGRNGLFMFSVDTDADVGATASLIGVPYTKSVHFQGVLVDTIFQAKSPSDGSAVTLSGSQTKGDRNAYVLAINADGTSRLMQKTNGGAWGLAASDATGGGADIDWVSDHFIGSFYSSQYWKGNMYMAKGWYNITLPDVTDPDFLDLFVNSDGTTKDPSLINAAVGVAPVFEFYGDSTTFLTNRGTGGAVVENGTWVDA